MTKVLIVGGVITGLATAIVLSRQGIERRFDRCKFVVETAAQLSYWQTHPGTPGADHLRVTAEGFGRLAGPF